MIVAVLFIIGLVLIWKFDKSKKWYQYIPLIFMDFILSFFIFMIISIIFCNFYEKEIVYDIENPIYLQAISNNNETDGEFFLGSGQIESNSYYYYYYKVDENSYIQKKIKTDNVIIYEEENCTQPRILTGTKQFKDKSSLIMCLSDEYYKIIVPKNSVIKKIDFSLK